MKHLFIFDIETVPDLRAAENLLGPQADLDQALIDYHLNATKGANPFLRHPFHKVVSIAFLVAEIEVCEDGEIYHISDLRSGGLVSANERELIQGFFSYLKELRPRLVSFNGRGFDLPVLKYRAMLHQVSAKWLYESGDKWNNYSSRYSLDWHCDLLEAFSDFGASARVRMQEVSALLNIPSKLDCDGAMVSDLYNQGRIQEIRDYCELDVVNTYLLYLRYMEHRGTLSHGSYNIACGDLLALMESQQGEKTHFAKYLEEYERLNS